MKRWLTILVFGLLGGACVIWALLVPAHFRAIDAAVLTRVKGPSVVDAALEFVNTGKIGPARMLAKLAHEQHLAGAEKLDLALSKTEDPGLLAWGATPPEFSRFMPPVEATNRVESRPILNWLVSPQTRQRVLEYLGASQRFGVRDVIRTRGLTNLLHFSPVGTPVGQPLDTVTLLTGLLLQGDNLSPRLRAALETAAFAAVREGRVQELELIYLDLISLGNRLDWGQLTELLRRIETLESLRDLANLTRPGGEQLPSLYASVILGPAGRGALDYLLRYGKSGLNDLRFCLTAGTGALRELLLSQRQISYPRLRDKLTQYEPFYSAFLPLLNLTVRSPGVGLAVKYGMLLAGGFLLAQLVSSLLPFWAGTASTWRLVGPGQLVFLVCFVLFVPILCEPFLMQQGQQKEFPGRWKFPKLEESVRLRTVEKNKVMIMDSFTTLSLLGFLVIQSALYGMCLAKIAQIRRQPLSSQLKLKLLENEEHMFDSGLYCGFGGTVCSFLLLAMGIVKPSLMAAYSSTLFGILFVAILKICHLRPFRKSLILTSESTR